ncbi:hypothetical protein GGH95_006691, partial [Coemansia sp. RSA 1836]
MLFARPWAAKMTPGQMGRIPALQHLRSLTSSATSSASGRAWQLRRWRRTAAIASASLGLGGYVVYNHDTAYLVAASMYRCSVAARVTWQVTWDYYRNFPNLPADDDDKCSAEERLHILAARSAVHLRSAER